ncbi:hypothetical protein OCU04_000108 [Sclerotinia nivalis]|uniref:Uncharacterized protein n=1 Tax=Sclerotinia nivalis TaxID=352851 RepID=A0A9X0AVI2_9HELO|nr:hypothetical protein OCU04_000108 [Sclerotinia nivalis]
MNHGQEPNQEPQLSGNFAAYGSGADLNMKIPQADILRVLEGVSVAMKSPDGELPLIQQWLTLDNSSSADLMVSEWLSRIDSAGNESKPKHGHQPSDGHTRARLVARLTVGVAFLRQKSRHDQSATPDDLDFTWRMVYDALSNDKLPGPLCTAARSAQGFVAVALCSLVKDGKIEELFRLHAWLPDGQRGNKDFAIHSHQAWAQSWILAGEGRNRTFHVRSATNPVFATHNKYALRWSDTKGKSNATTSYKIHQTFSIVDKTEEMARATLARIDLHTKNMSYKISSASYHTSTVEPEVMHATLFFFDAQRGFTRDSNVLGPTQGDSFVQVRDTSSTNLITLANDINTLRFGNI